MTILHMLLTLHIAKTLHIRNEVFSYNLKKSFFLRGSDVFSNDPYHHSWGGDSNLDRQVLDFESPTALYAGQCKVICLNIRGLACNV